jgi:hypothetical protein
MFNCGWFIYKGTDTKGLLLVIVKKLMSKFSVSMLISLHIHNNPAEAGKPSTKFISYLNRAFPADRSGPG